MSLTRVEVRNFQSLKKVDLELGQFTVIVGPSSSGKSALIRAFRALASNVRGTGVITRGQTQMAISATIDPDVKVTLERGDRASAYRLSAGGEQLTFTKLAGDVPEQVSKALRLDPGADSINFAGQFDKPYLLDESGAVVARQLAELTNVNRIFEAVRAANKIRTSTQATLRTRQADLAAVRKDLHQFEGIAERLDALDEVRTLDERRKALQARRGRLETALRALRVTETALEKYKPIEMPDQTVFDYNLNRYQRLFNRAAKLAANQRTADSARREVLAQANDVQHYEELVADRLKQAGVCPTCGQHLRYLETS